MIPEHSRKVKHFSKFAILYVFLLFLRIFWHHLNRAISILLFFLLQFYFLISSWNSSDRFCNRVLSGSIDFHCLPGFSTQCVPSFPSVLLSFWRSRSRPDRLHSSRVKQPEAHCRSGAWNRRPRLPGSRS